MALLRITGRLLAACAAAGLLLASAHALAQGAAGPEIESIDPAAWPDVVFAGGSSATAYPPVVISGVDFGTPPGRVFISDGDASLVATVSAPASTGSTGTAATAPSACAWTPTAISLTAACVSAAASSGGAGGTVLTPGNAWIQVQGTTGTSNTLPVTVQPLVSTLSVSVSPGSAPAGTPQTVTVTLEGPAGSVDGASVSLSVKGAGGGTGPQIASSTLTTGAGGTAQTTITDSAPETDLVTATYTNAANHHTVTASGSARFTGSCANLSAVAVTVRGTGGTSGAPAPSGQGQAVAGGPTLPITATFEAGGGVGVAGLPVVWSVAGAPGATLTPRTAITASGGTAETGFRADAPGTYTVEADCPGSQAAPGTLQVTVAPAASVHLRLAPAAARAAPGRRVVLRVVATNPLTGRPLAGLPVDLQAYGSARFPGGSQGVTLDTGAGGAATVAVSDPACQVAKVTASLGAAPSGTGQTTYGSTGSLPALVAPVGARLTVSGCRPAPRLSARSGPRCATRQPFADVGRGPVGDALCALYARGLVAGIPSGGRLLYEPDRAASLADLAAAVTGVLGVYGGQGTPPCAVAQGSWAAGAAAEAAQAFTGVAAAFPHCALTAPAALEDAASVLVRASGLEGAPLPASPDTILAAFPGALHTAPALRRDMATALERGFLPLTGRRVAPAAVVSRGDLALLAYRAWSLLRAERAEQPVVDAVSLRYQMGGGASLTIDGTGFGWQPAFSEPANDTLRISVCPAPTASAGSATGSPAAEPSCWTVGGATATAGVAPSGSGVIGVAQWGDRRITVAAICPSTGSGTAGGCAQGAALLPGDTVSLLVTNPVSGRQAEYRWVVGE